MKAQTTGKVATKGLPPRGVGPVTLDMVAQAAGVSPSTVSRILNGTAVVSEAKKKAVQDAVAKLGFVPNPMARGLAGGRTFSVGVITQAIDSPFYGSALRGIEDEMDPAGYSPLFVSGHWNATAEARCIDILRSRRVDGIIVLTGRLTDTALRKCAQNVPVVVTGRSLKTPNLFALNFDNFGGGRAGRKHENPDIRPLPVDDGAPLTGKASASVAFPAGAAALAVDGKADTAWSADLHGQEDPQLTLDLGTLREFGGVIDASLYMAASWPLIVLTFVVFFYCLSCLYDDRKDRSVLFWKSLPLSDGQTVLSKVTSALVVAPLFAMGAAIITSIGFLVLLSIYVLFHGGNPLTLIWGPASPITISLHMLASLPVYAAWALPTVGWLLLVSAWARTKPFLWALLVPVFAGILVTWFDVMEMFGSSAAWFWQHVVGRLLLGTVPGMDLVYRGASDPRLVNFNPDGPEDIVFLFSAQQSWGAFATLDLWIGVAVGVAMIFGAMHYRRSRDEG